MWSQVVGATWGTLPKLSMESMSMPRKEFVQGLCSAVHDGDHKAFFSTLASKAELALYQRIYEGPGFKEYLQRNLSTAGQQGALL